MPLTEIVLLKECCKEETGSFGAAGKHKFCFINGSVPKKILKGKIFIKGCVLDGNISLKEFFFFFGFEALKLKSATSHQQCCQYASRQFFSISTSNE